MIINMEIVSFIFYKLFSHVLQITISHKLVMIRYDVKRTVGVLVYNSRNLE